MSVVEIVRLERVRFCLQVHCRQALSDECCCHLALDQRTVGDVEVPRSNGVLYPGVRFVTHGGFLCPASDLDQFRDDVLQRQGLSHLRQEHSQSVALRHLGTALNGPYSEFLAVFEFLLGSIAIAPSSQIGTHVVTRTCKPPEGLRIGRAGSQLLLHHGSQSLELLGPVRILCRIGDTRRGMPAHEANQHTQMASTIEQPHTRGKHVHNQIGRQEPE